MKIVLLISLPIMIVIAFLTLIISGFLKDNVKTKIVTSLIVLSLGIILNGIIIYFLSDLYKSSRECSLSPNCMDESGLLYIFYYGLLFVTVPILSSGIIRTIRAFLKKNAKVTIENSNPRF